MKTEVRFQFHLVKSVTMGVQRDEEEIDRRSRVSKFEIKLIEGAITSGELKLTRTVEFPRQCPIL